MKTLIVLSFALFVAAAHAIEPWADDKLPVKDGLALWFDASAEDKAQEADGLQNERGKIAPGIWHDASGNKRRALQPDAKAQPERRVAYPMSAFHFDGQGCYLTVDSPGWKMREATVLVFARASSNAGGFRGLISASQPGANDYLTGFNLDLGAGASNDTLTELNAEGAGFRGEKNLLHDPIVFGKTFSAATVIGADKVALQLGTAPQGARPRNAGTTIDASHLLIGARTYDNTGKPPSPHGFFAGDIFEVLVYERALTAEEVRAINDYFTAKYAGVVYIAVAKADKAAGSVPLVAAKDSPEIQPLAPGFTARRLPVQLTNINFLRYRPDGRLYAGAYDGKIYVLRDTDGDGLEDTADVFYESNDLSVVMGMALTPPGYPLGEGVFVATRGRILLILDKHHTGHGDEVITVAENWEKQMRMGGGVSDALGIALGPDGSVYFSLGTSDFTNAYLLDAATGKAGYRLESERGTVQHVSPDFSRRETVCTGTRYLFDLAFNRAGDLFATEQEGATWLANGNPFDELLHIQPGRHYGFPPRHPQHLPNVIDEPSTFDFGPQHQSTVGLAFDEPVAEGAPIFGAPWWRGDALISAMSRGKIFRTKLVKTDAGYVAKSETFAQLQRIIIDDAVSPRGALTVTIHGGSPDWGSGPKGMGELWQITAAKALPPQPADTWSASPREFRVSFDAALPEGALAAMQGKVHVTQGRDVEDGDRFETMRPGYQVVKNQLAAPRYPVAVQKLALADDNRTLVITTSEHTAAVNYGISIEADPFQAGGGAPYGGQIDVLADLTGLEAEWQPASGASVKAWLPHPNLAIAREFTAAGAAAREFFASLAKEGRISLRGQFDLGLMLYPAVQVGSKLDWEYPPEQVTVVLEADRPFEFTLGGSTVASQPKGARHSAAETVTAKEGSWFAFNVAFATGTGDPALTTSWFTDRSATPRPFPLRRILLPYAQPQELPSMPHNENLPQLAGANWLHGRDIFQATCTICHQMRGAGGKVGPDLTNLIYRDYDSVLRDIREPSATINPEHVGYTITKKDGSAFNAVLLGETASGISIGLPGAPPLEIPRAEIASMKQLTVSLMPEGLDKALSATQMRDLMGYLLLPPLEPAPLMISGAPPPRKLGEVKAILGDALTAPADPHAKPLRIVLCASEKDKAHGQPGYHDYPLWRARWSRLLGMAEGVTIETTNDWPAAAQWEHADAIVFNTYNPAWAGQADATKIAELGQQMDAFLARGGGLVFLHYAMNGGASAESLAARLGLAWGKGARFRHGASDWLLDPSHPLAAGFSQFHIPDESYWNLTGNLTTAQANVLATSDEESAPRPQMWTRETGPGRVFVSIPGHFTWTYDDPLYRILIFRGLMWATHQPIDRLAPLVPIGARVEN